MTSQVPYESASLSPVANITESGPEEIIPLIDYELYYIIRLSTGAILTTTIAAIGVFTNTINIIVYAKMGLQETTNINFFSLAIVDWLSAVCLIVMVISNQIDVRLPSGAKADEITNLTSFILYAASGTGAFITTILSMERCLCIVIPLRVKKILTRRRVIFLILVMAVYEIVFVGLLITRTGPPYSTYSMLKALYLLCCYSAISLACFAVISISTIFLIIRLRQSVSWRKTTSTASGQMTANKESKATRCVIFICMLFIVCFFPNLFTIIIVTIYPTFNLWDPYFNRLAYIVCLGSFLCQAISISANTLVYYTMSSKYRQVFRSLFCCFKDEKM
ncbi:RNA-directed DNA polymerase from mobile element jockey [Plakobranchus ocellatus]|uniref:RNA-directed DNA polymerase from mobile element jockey n=1 Tax=Plakobranchus ocellatus TaxID=259542 RepID=A0AAV3YJJ3_9GAST|nr:RNA-directed DNA polymerase from mobile element jockey [Plakobranchus ocellatus]